MLIKTKGILQHVADEWWWSSSVPATFTFKIKTSDVEQASLLVAAGKKGEPLEMFIEVPDSDEWKKRALAAEDELAQLKKSLRALTSVQ